MRFLRGWGNKIEIGNKTDNLDFILHSFSNFCEN